jgi:chromosome segregation ATPase
MTNQSLIEHLIEIKETLAANNSKLAVVEEKLDRHSEESRKTRLEIDDLKKDANRAKGAIAFISVLGVVISIAVALHKL